MIKKVSILERLHFLSLPISQKYCSRAEIRTFYSPHLIQPSPKFLPKEKRIYYVENNV